MPIKLSLSLGVWINGLEAGFWVNKGLGGAATDLAHSVDPRTRQGALGLASMLVPGKPSAENALAAHLGHSQFRPYQAVEGRNTGDFGTGLYMPPDQYIHGGAMTHGQDLGYSEVHPESFVGREVKRAFFDPARHGFDTDNLLYLLAKSWRKGLKN